MNEGSELYNKINENLTRAPACLEEIVGIHKYIENKDIDKDMTQLKSCITTSNHYFHALNSIQHKQKTEKYGMFFASIIWIKTLERVKADTNNKVPSLLNRFKPEMVKMQSTATTEIKQIDFSIKQFYTYNNVDDCDKYVSIAQECINRIEKIERNCEKINDYESIFNQPLSDYSKVLSMKKIISSFHSFWQLYSKWKFFYIDTIMQTFHLLNEVKFQNQIEEMCNTLNDLMTDTTLSSPDSCTVQIMANFETEISTFRNNIVPITMALKSESFKNSGWIKFITLLKSKKLILSENDAKEDKITLKN